MRLSELKNLISDTRNTVYNYRNVTDPTVIMSSDFKNILRSVDNLKSINAFNESLNSLKQLNYQISLEKVIMSTEEKNVFDSILVSIIEKCDLIYSILDQYIGQQDGLSLNIKLPDINGDLADLSKEIIELDTTFNQFLNTIKKDNKIKISSVEPGSIWLNILPNTIETTVVIWIVINGAIKLRMKHIECEKSLVQLKMMRLDLEEAETRLKEKNKKMLQETKENLVEDLERKLNIELSSEDNSRMKNVLDRLSSFFKKGGDIQPSISPAMEADHVLVENRNLMSDYKDLLACSSNDFNLLDSNYEEKDGNLEL